MGDVAVMARRMQDKGIQYGWCGNGGYLSGMLPSMLIRYDTDRLVEELFSMGELAHVGLPGSERGGQSIMLTTRRGDSPLSIADTERMMFSQIAFIDHGYLREMDGTWYYVIPGPFRIKIPLYMALLELKDDFNDDDNEYLNHIDKMVIKYIFEEYPKEDAGFLDFLKENGVEKDELEKHLLENTNSVYMLWEKHRNIFRYFDDWILCLPDETMRKCEKVVMRKKQENGKRMETCDWLICQTKQEEREKNILTLIRAFQRNGFSVEKIVKEIMEGFQLSHDEATAYIQKSNS